MYDKIVITNMQKCGFEEKCQLELFRFNPSKRTWTVHFLSSMKKGI